jgi:hypothetical protein
VHRRFSKFILGKAYPEVDRFIDLVGVVGMRGHRRYLHTPLEAAVVSTVLTGSPLPGILHVTLDQTFKKQKRRVRQRQARGGRP